MNGVAKKDHVYRPSITVSSLWALTKLSLTSFTSCAAVRRLMVSANRGVALFTDIEIDIGKH